MLIISYTYMDLFNILSILTLISNIVHYIYQTYIQFLSIYCYMFILIK